MLYQIEKGSVSLGGELILDHIDFEIRGFEKIAVTGKNGAGKTTLLRLISGELSLDPDDRRFSPGILARGGVTIGMLSQHGFGKKKDPLSQIFQEALPVTERFSREESERKHDILKVITAFGFPKEALDKPPNAFSGGEQTRLALALLLLQKPDILLLDEPTNHLDIRSTEWLEGYIRSYAGAVVMVSHDRYFLDQTAQIVFELEDGKLTRYVGNYSAFRAQKEKNEVLLRRKYRAMEQKIRETEALIERFKHKPRKAAMTRAKKSQLARMKRIAPPKKEERHLFTEKIQPAFRGPKNVLETTGLSVGYDKPLCRLDFLLRRGRKTGIIGPNGAGKSTLLKTICGTIPPLSGQVSLGEGVTLAYFDQHTAEIDSEESVLPWFEKAFPNKTRKEIRQTLAAYLFTGTQTNQKIRDLSGGEKSRLMLARILESRPNLILLDEPTNHMDIPAKETFESAFKQYTGSLLFVTHDRYFLNEVADSLLIFEDGKVHYHPFDYAHYRRMCEKQSNGDGVDAVFYENAKLVEGLHAVPEKERHETARYSTGQAYAEWQLTLAGEALKEAAILWAESLALSEIPAVCSSLSEWMAANEKEIQTHQKNQEEAEDRYTKACLLWYDRFLEYEDAFSSYRE